MVVSTVWKGDIIDTLDKSPEFELVPMDRYVEGCEACELEGRVSTQIGRALGEPYDKDTFEVSASISLSITRSYLVFSPFLPRSPKTPVRLRPRRTKVKTEGRVKTKVKAKIQLRAGIKIPLRTTMKERARARVRVRKVEMPASSV